MAYSPGYDIDFGGSAYVPAYDLDFADAAYAPSHAFDFSETQYTPVYDVEFIDTDYRPSYDFDFAAIDYTTGYDFDFAEADYTPGYDFDFSIDANRLGYDFDFAETASQTTSQAADENAGNVFFKPFSADGWFGSQGDVAIFQDEEDFFFERSLRNPYLTLDGADHYNQGLVTFADFVVNGFIQVQDYGAIDIPSISIDGQVGAEGVVDFPVVFSADGRVGAEGVVDFPVVFSVDGFIAEQLLNGATVNVPEFSVQANTGLSQDQPITVGPFSIDGTITNVFGNVLRADPLTWPPFSTDGSINSGALLRGGIDIVLPFDVDGYAGAQGEIRVPAFSAGASSTAGSVSRGEVLWPRLTTEASGFAETILSGEIVFPLFESVSAIGAIDVPLFDVSGTISQPITRTGIAYAMNLAHKEVTRYTNYDFDYLLRFGNEYYGVRADGLYRIEGFQDESAQISAQIKTTPMDFGTFKHKRVPYAYIGSDTPLRVKPFHDNTQTGTFDSRWDAERVRLTRGPRSRYFALQIENVDGARMRLERMEILAQVLSRKTGRRKVA